MICPTVWTHVCSLYVPTHSQNTDFTLLSRSYEKRKEKWEPWHNDLTAPNTYTLRDEPWNKSFTKTGRHLTSAESLKRAPIIVHSESENVCPEHTTGKKRAKVHMIQLSANPGTKHISNSAVRSSKGKERPSTLILPHSPFTTTTNTGDPHSLGILAFSQAFKCSPLLFELFWIY